MVASQFEPILISGDLYTVHSPIISPYCTRRIMKIPRHDPFMPTLEVQLFACLPHIQIELEQYEDERSSENRRIGRISLFDRIKDNFIKLSFICMKFSRKRWLFMSEQVMALYIEFVKCLVSILRFDLEMFVAAFTGVSIISILIKLNFFSMNTLWNFSK